MIELPDTYGDTAVFQADTEEGFEEWGKMWVCADAQIVLAAFENRDDARDFQRLFRLGNGLNPETGDFIIE